MKMTLKSFLVAFIAVVLLVPACQNNTQPETANTPAADIVAKENPTVSVTGLFAKNTTDHILRDCNSGNTYWVDDQTKSLDTLYPKFLLEPSYPFEPIFAILKGQVSPKPAAGPGANYDGVLAVSKVDSLDFLNFINCCESWDFWCSGTEPFWSLQIFPVEGEGNIIFREAGGEKAFVFPTVKPTIKGDTWTYASQTADGKQSISVVIKKGESNDGMSEVIYHYSANVTLGKEKFKGVAIKYGEDPKSFEPK